MSIHLGSTNIGKVYLGPTEITKIYLGDKLVFNAGSTPPSPGGVVPNVYKTHVWDSTESDYVVTSITDTEASHVGISGVTTDENPQWSSYVTMGENLDFTRPHEIEFYAPIAIPSYNRGNGFDIRFWFGSGSSTQGGFFTVGSYTSLYGTTVSFNWTRGQTGSGFSLYGIGDTVPNGIYIKIVSTGGSDSNTATIYYRESEDDEWTLGGTDTQDSAQLDYMPYPLGETSGSIGFGFRGGNITVDSTKFQFKYTEE